MSDVPQGDGWWQTGDGKWYPPEKHPDYVSPLPPPPTHVVDPPELLSLTEAVALDSVSDEGTSAKRSRRPAAVALISLGVLLVVLIAGIALLTGRSGSKRHEVTGVLEVHDSDATGSGDTCTLSDGYDDISEGTTVEITDGTGKVIGIGSLDRPARIANSIDNALTSGCSFTFYVDKVSKTAFYNVEVSHRGKVGYSYDQMVANLWTVSLKLGS
jgi:hypothetical protein